MIIVLLEPAFLFFVLTSGRPLPVTTFFVFSKPLCSHFAAQIVIREFSAPLQKRCLSLSKGFPLQPKFAAAAAQRFYSSFVALLEAILQRCSFRTGYSTDVHMFIIFIRLRPIFSQPFARILVRFVLPHFWLYLFVGFHDRYVIKAFRTAYLVELTKTPPTSTRCTAQVVSWLSGA